MRKLLVTTFVSLDGVMQAPGGPDEDPEGGFAHGGWTVGFWDQMMGDTMDEILAKPFDLLLGRKTYDIFAGFWPTATTDESVAKPFNAATKYVASRGRPDLSWERSVLIEDAAQGVAALKASEGPELQVHGSGDLLQTLIRHGLVDEFHVWIFPTLLGPGKRLFAEGAVPGSLELVDSRVSSTGVIIGTYRPAGTLVTGSF